MQSYHLATLWCKNASVWEASKRLRTESPFSQTVAQPFLLTYGVGTTPCRISFYVGRRRRPRHLDSEFPMGRFWHMDYRLTVRRYQGSRCRLRGPAKTYRALSQQAYLDMAEQTARDQRGRYGEETRQGDEIVLKPDRCDRRR